MLLCCLAAGIASVDDDRLISEEDLMFAFSVWQVSSCVTRQLTLIFTDFRNGSTLLLVGYRGCMRRLDQACITITEL